MIDGRTARCLRIAAARRRPRKGGAGRPGRPQTRESFRTEKDECPQVTLTLDLFGDDHLPEGMKYQADFLSAEEERNPPA